MSECICDFYWLCVQLHQKKKIEVTVMHTASAAETYLKCSLQKIFAITKIAG